MTTKDFKVGDIVCMSVDTNAWFGSVVEIDSSSSLLYFNLRERNETFVESWNFNAPGDIRLATEIEKALYE